MKIKPELTQDRNKYKDKILTSKFPEKKKKMTRRTGLDVRELQQIKG